MNYVRYRYFLAFRPDPALRYQLAALCGASCQFGGRVKTDYLHLTLCVVAELDHRDCFIVRRLLAAFARGLPSSCPIRLGRVRGGTNGAAIYTIGRRPEIQAFYRQLLSLLVQHQVQQLHRASGLHPHVTLGYDQCAFKRFNVPLEWIPDELALIESEVGRGAHNVLHRWPLFPPPQGRLPFEAVPSLPTKRTAFSSGR